jgi:hypothetical protein
VDLIFACVFFPLIIPQLVRIDSFLSMMFQAQLLEDHVDIKFCTNKEMLVEYILKTLDMMQKERIL